MSKGLYLTAFCVVLLWETSKEICDRVFKKEETKTDTDEIEADQRERKFKRLKRKHLN